MIWQATEGELTWLAGVSYADLPQPWPTAIPVRVRPGSAADADVGIEPQGVVGTVPLLNGGTVQILPKIGMVDFFTLFMRAGGVEGDLSREFQEFVSYSASDEPNIGSLAARQLCVAAADILRLGPHVGRVKRRREGVIAMGRLDARATAFNTATRRHNPAVFWTRERTYDVPENRVLTEAIIRSWMVLSDQDRESLEAVHDRWLSRFPRSLDIEHDLESIARGFVSGQYGGSRDYYRRALMLAQVVLGGFGLAFGEGTAVEADALLLNTANVYEKFVRNVIAARYLGRGYVVSDGQAWAMSLYADGSRRLLPDIVVSARGTIRLIADAKYKHPDASDHYQMYAYLHASQVDVGLFLAPAFEGDQVGHKRFSTTHGKVVWEISLPMSNLQATEEFLGGLVEWLDR